MWGLESEGESMTILVGTWQQAGRCGPGAVAESLHLDSQVEGKEPNGKGLGFWNLKTYF